MSLVLEGRAANHPLVATTFNPPIGALFPGARVNFAVMGHFQSAPLGQTRKRMGIFSQIHWAVGALHAAEAAWVIARTCFSKGASQ